MTALVLNEVTAALTVRMFELEELGLMQRIEDGKREFSGQWELTEAGKEADLAGASEHWFDGLGVSAPELAEFVRTEKAKARQ